MARQRRVGVARQRRVGQAIALALVTLAVAAAPAWAVAPSGGTIVVQPGKLGVTADGRITAPGLVKWKPAASDAAGVGCCTYRVTDLQNGGRVTTTTAKKFPITLRDGVGKREYAYQIDGYDAAGSYLGQTFAPAESFITFFQASDDNDSEVGYTAGWDTRSQTGAFGGRVHRALRAGATATFGPVYGNSFGVVMAKGPTMGSVEIWLDGRLVASVGLNAPTLQTRQIVHVTAPDRAGFDRTHVISVVAGPDAGRLDVLLDGFVFTWND
jgi:hypothetical protein